MEKLLEYIKEAKLDNAILLTHFASISSNKMLLRSMQNSDAVRDTYIRYEVWKILPTDVQKKYNQSLELLEPEEEEKKEKATDEIVVGTTVKVTDTKTNATLTEGTFLISMGENMYDVTIQNGVAVKSRKLSDEEISLQKQLLLKEEGDNESNQKSPQDAQQEDVKSDDADQQNIQKSPQDAQQEDVKSDDADQQNIQERDALDEIEKAKLYNQKAQLSNSLLNFDESDNEGRKKVLEEIAAIEAKMQSEPVKEQNNKIDWLKSSDEKAKMSKAEMKVYKTQLTNRRGKASSCIKKGDNVAENERIILLIDNERLTLG